MSIWKDFCRMVESKVVRRNFGDLVPLVETSALFEFTAPQIEKALAYVPDPSDDQPVPPVPFPRMCMVGPGGVIVLQSPTMEDTALRFDAFVWTAGMSKEDGQLLSATCFVDTASTAKDVIASGLRGVMHGKYFDENESPPGLDRDDGFMGRAKDAIVKMETAGDRPRAEKARAILRKWQDAQGVLDATTAQLQEAMTDLKKAQLDLLRKSFQLGLQEVQWINKPDHYTVEIGVAAPARKSGKTTGSRARRLPERTRYIVLTKSEIADAWHRVHRGGTHASPLPHLRRGHYRTINAQTESARRVWVRATHVNGTCVEWRDGDVRYRVI